MLVYMQKHFEEKRGRENKMNYTAEMERYTNIPTFVEKFRLIIGVLMMFAGLYFGLFTAGISESLGLLTFIASPFVMVTDK